MIFEDAVKSGRIAYWTGVRDAQLGTNQSNERARTARMTNMASYMLGRFHVQEGIIHRYPVAAVHDGPLFKAGVELDERMGETVRW